MEGGADGPRATVVMGGGSDECERIDAIEAGGESQNGNPERRISTVVGCKVQTR